MDLTNAPKTKSSVLGLEELADRLRSLVGTPIALTRKPRTDGANIRKLVSKTIIDRIHNALDDGQYEVLPPKGKGIPRLLLELIDTYVVTSGNTYNLQVWNRSPNSDTPLIRFQNDEVIYAKDIRLVLIKVNVQSCLIESIVIMTPEYIEHTFGVFGKPTIKQQLLVSNRQRQKIVISNTHIHITTDTERMLPHITSHYVSPSKLSCDQPESGKLFSMVILNEYVAKHLIGVKLLAADTKTRGQLLEKMVIEYLGYGYNSRLVGGYPDLPNQLLEVKVQDAQTIDLGRYSPQFMETINEELGLTTQDVRYLIALTNPNTQTIEGIILCAGKNLGDVFTYVSDKSYKCQRSIPMSFFDKFKGQCVANPQFDKEV